MSAPRTANVPSRVATGLYVAWGLLHLGLGVSMAVRGLDQPAGELQAESTMFFVCAAVLGAMAIVIALTLNRRNDPVGFWLNLGMVGAVDAAFVVILVVPGHVDLLGGLSGPVLYLAAAATSALALRRTPQPIVNSSTA